MLIIIRYKKWSALNGYWTVPTKSFLGHFATRPMSWLQPKLDHHKTILMFKQSSRLLIMNWSKSLTTLKKKRLIRLNNHDLYYYQFSIMYYQHER